MIVSKIMTRDSVFLNSHTMAELIEYVTPSIDINTTAGAIVLNNSLYYARCLLRELPREKYLLRENIIKELGRIHSVVGVPNKPIPLDRVLALRGDVNA